MSQQPDSSPNQHEDRLSVSRLAPEEEGLFSAPAPQIDGYQILEKLGEAGQGQVWRAVQTSTGRQVALKVPRIGLLSSRKTLARFEREVEIVARLKHPHISTIIDSGIHRGLYFYVMELVEGVHLDRYVRDNGLSRRQILTLMKTVCEAVHHAHESGIIHRDLKPSNIIVTPEGDPYIVDFGLAKNLAEPGAGPGVSMEGDTPGTPAYMSPEQAAGHTEQLDTRTDVYSLGAILYTLLTNRYPHDLSGSHMDVLCRIAEQEVIRPREIDPTIDRDLEGLLLKALARDVANRYSSADELAAEIDNYLKGTPLHAFHAPRRHRIRLFLHRHPAATAAGAVVSAVGLAATLAILARVDVLRQRGGQPPQLRRSEEETPAVGDGSPSSTEIAARKSLLDSVPHSIAALAHYRAEQWQEVIDASQTAVDLHCGPQSSDLFVQALAHWRLGDRQTAAARYWSAMQRMRDEPSPPPAAQDLRREAAATLRMQAATPGFDFRIEGTQIDNVTATSTCESMSGIDPNVLLSNDGLTDSNLDGDLEQDNDANHMWLGMSGEDAASLEFDLHGVHSLNAIQVWNYNATGQSHRGLKTARLLAWMSGSGWKTVLDKVQFDEAPDRAGYDNPIAIPLGEIQAQRLRLEQMTSFDDPEYVGLAKVQFFDVRNHRASRPAPADGADIGVAKVVNLRWTPALDAINYRVYLGADSRHMSLLGDVQKECGIPCSMPQTHRWHYWKVDAVRADGSTVEGPTWAFSTGDLVAWWRLDKIEGDRVIDSSGRGNHGRLAGNPQWQQDLSGGAIAFDGYDDYISIDNGADFNITSEITLACRVKVTRFTAAWQPILTKGNYSWRLIRAANRQSIEFACTGLDVPGTVWGNVCGTTPVDDGQWHHIAGVCDGNELRLYIDGLLDASIHCSGRINSRSDPVLIAANSNDPLSELDLNPWYGSIQDVRVYSYALTPEEVAAVSSGAGPDPLARPESAAKKSGE
jgi:serine/threonine protein kinase